MGEAVEELECRQERGNGVDCYTVAVVKDEEVLGHLLRMTQDQTLNTASHCILSTQLVELHYSSKQCNNPICMFNFC